MFKILIFINNELLLSNSTPSNLFLLYIFSLFLIFYEENTKSIAPEFLNYEYETRFLCVYLQYS